MTRLPISGLPPRRRPKSTCLTASVEYLALAHVEFEKPDNMPVGIPSRPKAIAVLKTAPPGWGNESPAPIDSRGRNDVNQRFAAAENHFEDLSSTCVDA